MYTLIGIGLLVAVAMLSSKEQRKGAWLLAAVVITDEHSASLRQRLHGNAVAAGAGAQPYRRRASLARHDSPSARARLNTRKLAT
jgi:hypothetical protein